MKIEKVEKLVASLNDQTEYVILQTRNSKQALNHGLVLKTLKLSYLNKQLG